MTGAGLGLAYVALAGNKQAGRADLTNARTTSLPPKVDNKSPLDLAGTGPSTSVQTSPGSQPSGASTSQQLGPSSDPQTNQTARATATPTMSQPAPVLPGYSSGRME